VGIISTSLPNDQRKISFLQEVMKIFVKVVDETYGEKNGKKVLH